MQGLCGGRWGWWLQRGLRLVAEEKARRREKGGDGLMIWRGGVGGGVSERGLGFGLGFGLGLFGRAVGVGASVGWDDGL